MINEKILQQLNLLEQKYQEIEKQLLTLDIKSQREKYTELSKEQKRLEPIINQFLVYQKIKNSLIEEKQYLESEKDAELVEMLKAEIKANEQKLIEAEEKLQLILIPKDDNDNKNVIFEIRGAVGGEEANIFAGDLYRMYLKYSENQNWKVETIEAKESPSGGFTYIAFMIRGKQVFSKLKYEAGAHRVQRVPKTESQGRIHTSIATVAVLPEASEIDVNVNPNDLKIDTYRSSGAGGQHVNTTDSAVRITHLPSGIVVTSQDGRSQHDNKDKAMRVLRAKLYEFQLSQQQGEIGDIRKNAVGSGERSEKIRTYNYPQNRVTDHRIGLTLNKLDQVIEGNLDEIILALISAEERRKLENLENEVMKLN
ncbi:Peptide chain release factor 1 [Spiroplasma platyhelix PALS-1]|uniref:Peptide chain release factor 1 n=1 Tax=Spiroplasma platyhelix PALS-1 TaxID=1276218 RepID=A0A846TQI5_9MOLU|nr:Peptide chain release factor 1 [Spiroplasma platyhelix PALS-1]NKE38590.1 peptide chain release factor 1 [Spiroplasma platyhelix PALS-1]UJB28801.1 peptide chain release factor 1 [Spiroplasma platyhelix PALS-1]